jgi:hypothetical protein
MSPSSISSLDTVYQLNVNILTVYKITINICMVHSVFWLRLFLPQNLFIDMKYCFNIGEGLCSEWKKYTSVKLYLVLSYTVLI